VKDPATPPADEAASAPSGANGPSNGDAPPPVPAQPWSGRQAPPHRRRLLAVADRINPVTVREVRQSIRNRGFVVALGMILLAIAATATMIAANYDGMTAGEPFRRANQVLLFFVVLVVPFRAMNAVGKETEPGLTEQILLTRLSPGRIIDGHLLTSFAQIVLIVCLFSPLLALSYLLRGVSVLEVACALGFATTAAIGVAAAGTAVGSLGRAKAIKQPLRALAAIGIVWLGFGLVAMTEGLRFYVRIFGTPDGWLVAASWLCGLGLWVALCRLIAKAMLAHPYENRSTGFRIHALVVSAVLLAIALFSMRRTGLARDLVPLIATAFGLAAPFWLVAATEDDGLSPCVAARVPKNPVLAVLLSPLYPGGSRGLLFALLHMVTLLGLLLAIPLLVSASLPRSEDLGLLVLAACYGVFYLSLGRVVRGWLGPGTKRSWIALAILVGILALCSGLPLLFDVLVFQGSGDWHPGHILDPFYTMAEFERRPWGMVAVVGALSALPLALCLKRLGASAAEIVRASRARRDAVAH